MVDSSDRINLCGRCGRPCSCWKDRPGDSVPRLRLFKRRSLPSSNLVSKAKRHLDENNMSYLGHFRFAFTHGIRCIKAGWFLIIHAIFPCWFRHVGSWLVHKLEKDFKEHRKR